MSSPPKHSRGGGGCPYAALGLPRGTADATAIKRAFIEAAKGNHPDHLPSSSSAAQRAAAASRFAAVADAYALLSDASRKAAFDRTGFSGGAAGSQYYRSNASYNPYASGSGFRPSSSSSSSSSSERQTRRPSFFLSNLFRLVAARSTRGDAWAHVALAAAVLGGAALAATAGDDLWRAANKGKLFEDVVAESLRRQQKDGKEGNEKEEGTSASSPASPPTVDPAPAAEASPE